MRKSLTQYLLIGFAITLSVSTASASSLNKISKKIAKGTQSLENKKIAILAFPYHNGATSSGSSIISERLTTDLVNRGVRVVERRLLRKILEERKLSETGVIDPDTAKEIGKILGVDAIVTGTLVDMKGNKTDVNARLIYTETGEIVTAAHSRIERSWKDRPRFPIAKKKTIKKNVVEKNEAPEELEAEAAIPDRKTLNKGLSLSNENFPRSRRIYHSTSAPDPKKKKKRRRSYGSSKDREYNKGFSNAMKNVKKKKTPSSYKKRSLARERLERAKTLRDSYHKSNTYKHK